MALDVGRRRLARAVTAARREGRATPSVVIVGAGLSGLAAAMQLVRSGVRDFTIVEQSDGVGGTWRDNTYPGAACDVPSHLYSFSFAPKCDWSRRFAEQPEILTYAERCVTRFGLGPHLRLGTTVEDATLDEGSGRWRVTVSSPADGSEVLEADALVLACGQLNRPWTPDLPGLDGFAGDTWHSARWDHRAELAGKRVAVVGNGASAVQFVPPVAARAASVTVYQRSANYVAPKADVVFSPRRRWWLEHVRPVELAQRWWIYWTLEARWTIFRKGSWAGRLLTDRFVTGIRGGVVSERLPEPAVLPDYPVGCKRILISDDWFPALLGPTVEVVTEPIARVGPEAVVTADGRSRPADTLIFGTGFRTTDFLAHLPVTGRGGRTLAGAWADGARAYRGTCVPGFPDCFVLYGPNTNLGHNSILFMVERQLNLVLQSLAAQVESGTSGSVGSVEVTPEAYDRDDAYVQGRAGGTVWLDSCRSWYKNAAGRLTNNWPGFTVAFWARTLRLERRDLRITAPRTAPEPSPEPAPATAGRSS
jgi:cation diffusion facilitator CzcD-associated flavoprotein CzcO